MSAPYPSNKKRAPSVHRLFEGGEPIQRATSQGDTIYQTEPRVSPPRQSRAEAGPSSGTEAEKTIPGSYKPSPSSLPPVQTSMQRSSSVTSHRSLSHQATGATSMRSPPPPSTVQQRTPRPPQQPPTPFKLPTESRPPSLGMAAYQPFTHMPTYQSVPITDITNPIDEQRINWETERAIKAEKERDEFQEDLYTERKEKWEVQANLAKLQSELEAMKKKSYVTYLHQPKPLGSPYTSRTPSRQDPVPPPPPPPHPHYPHGGGPGGPPGGNPYHGYPYPGGGPPGGPPGGPGGPNGLYGQPVGPQQLPLTRIKTAPPEFFDGSTHKLEDWFRQMETMFILQSQHFQYQEARILTAFQFCRGGTAQEWAKHHTEQYLNALGGNQYIVQDVVWTWDELKLKMKDRFGDKYQKETARRKIATISQGTKTMKEYIETFITLIPKVELPEDQLCNFLIGGVNNEIWDMLRLVDIPTSDLNALTALLELAEQNWVKREVTRRQREAQLRRKWEIKNKSGSNNTSGNQQNKNQTYFQNTRKEERPPAPRPNFPPRPSGSNSRPLPPGHGDPMDIDALRQKQQRLQDVKCFKCLQKGHFAKDCKVKNIRELSEETCNEILQMHLAKIEEDPAEEIDLTNPYEGKVTDEVILEHSDDEELGFY